jgi:hypothetical protein
MNHKLCQALNRARLFYPPRCHAFEAWFAVNVASRRK